jgi:hypothetical protein
MRPAPRLRGRARPRYVLPSMKPLHARVQNGRLILDEATTLPEGTVLELAAIDGSNDDQVGRSGSGGEDLRAAQGILRAGAPLDRLLEEWRHDPLTEEEQRILDDFPDARAAAPFTLASLDHDPCG